MFESCRPDLRKPLGNKGLSAFLGSGVVGQKKSLRYLSATSRLSSRVFMPHIGGGVGKPPTFGQFDHNQTQGIRSG